MDAAALDDWRNIQDVVRKTFKSLHEAVRAQGERLRAMEQRQTRAPTQTDLENLEVGMGNKPTFAEVGKAVSARFEEVGLSSLRVQLSSKAGKAELKDLYSDVTLATQRLGDGSAALEALVRQQQGELEALKREVRQLSNVRSHQEDFHLKFATRKWVEETLDLEGEARKAAAAALRKDVAEKLLKVEDRVQALPTVATLDEVFAQKVDMATFTAALQERPTQAQHAAVVAAEVGEARRSLSERTAAAVREGVEVATRRAKAEAERVEDLLVDKVSQTELLELCGAKVGEAEVDRRLASVTEEVMREVTESIRAMRGDLVETLNKKAFKAELERAKRDMASKDDVDAWLSSKADLGDVRDALAHKADGQAVLALDARVDGVARAAELREQEQREREQEQGLHGDGGGEGGLQAECEALRAQVTDLQERLGGALESKASVKDVCVLLDQKANISDVNDALAKLSARGTRGGGALGLGGGGGGGGDGDGEGDGDAFGRDDPGGPRGQAQLLRKLRREVDGLAEAVSAELTGARWIWSSGRALPDRAVPWNVECINTATDNFLWQKDAADITTIMPGLYELHLGFFTETDPDVKVLLNGEPILYSSARKRSSAQPQPQPQGPHAPARAGNRPVATLQRAKHSAGNVTGWTLVEFVALPARARITVVYQGDMGAQGFLALRKR